MQQHLTLQLDLQALGFVAASAVIDGVYGDQTRAAIVAFQQSQHAPANRFLDKANTMVDANAVPAVGVQAVAATSQDWLINGKWYVAIDYLSRSARLPRAAARCCHPGGKANSAGDRARRRRLPLQR